MNTRHSHHEASDWRSARSPVGMSHNWNGTAGMVVQKPRIHLGRLLPSPTCLCSQVNALVHVGEPLPERANHRNVPVVGKSMARHRVPELAAVVLSCRFHNFPVSTLHRCFRFKPSVSHGIGVPHRSVLTWNPLSAMLGTRRGHVAG